MAKQDAGGGESLASHVEVECTPLPCPTTSDVDADSTTVNSGGGLRPSKETSLDAPSAAAPAEVPRTLREPLLALESWEIDEDLRHMQRLLRGRSYADSSLTSEWRNRIDAPHASQTTREASAAESSRGALASIGAVLAKMALLTGVTTLACGLALLAWWYFGERADLCTPGLAATIAGQFLLMMGLVWQPDPPSPPSAAPPRQSLSDHPLLYVDARPDSDRDRRS